MSSSQTIDALNRLSVLHSRSLPVYLRYAHPWTAGNNGQAMESLEAIAAAHLTMDDRVGSLIVEFGGDVNPGEFPMTYTSLHDLSLDYLLGLVIQQQRDTVPKIRQCVADLQLVPLAHALAEEALGEARGHLESLEELARERSPNAS